MNWCSLAGAIVVGAALIVAAMFGRYEISTEQGAQSVPLVFRVDRLTGRVETCQIAIAFAAARASEPIIEGARQPTWCKPSLT